MRVRRGCSLRAGCPKSAGRRDLSNPCLVEAKTGSQSTHHSDCEVRDSSEEIDYAAAWIPNRNLNPPTFPKHAYWSWPCRQCGTAVATHSTNRKLHTSESASEVWLHPGTCNVSFMPPRCRSRALVPTLADNRGRDGDGVAASRLAERVGFSRDQSKNDKRDTELRSKASLCSA
ncbi:hypothetical protein BU23DRAFT_301592 [Bimuria novae-zelandiae CBS 107.79]|uniref:Uncharacterized protein n=1 Tax=Bimuria novae-zelandiae CBS 107.79 TaxID=1447943 RepID=A0A6A5UQU2_9PLEO|nr:hypothetical protein BU23DRAFT_301592 [Bimuria novae-zelandiae CBS 107.79]